MRWSALITAPALTLAIGCDDYVRERAEPPAEPTIVVPLRADTDAGNIRLAGGVDFDGGVRIDDVIVSPARPRPGEPLRVTMMIHGSTSREHVLLGLRPPHSSGRELARAEELTDSRIDHRDVFVELELRDGPLEVELELPDPWHPATAVLELILHDGARFLPAIRGARTKDGRALLGLVRVERRPTTIVAASGTPTLDGVLDEALWGRDPAILVQSLDGEPFAGPPTEVWFAWDQEHLYVAGKLADDDLWSTYEDHDDPLYKQEAFEIFLAADGSGQRYLELQVSARGVTFDARFPTYRRGDEAWDSRWRTAVSVSGTINDDRDRDQGWSVEAAIPWAEICEETSVTCPIGHGSILRTNVFRLEHPKRKRADGFALSPTLRPDFHAWENAAVLELR